MNKSELDLVLRTVGRYVRKLTGGITDEVKALREKFDRFAEGASDADIGWTERGTLRGAIRAATDSLTKRIEALEGGRKETAAQPDPGVVRAAVEAHLREHPPQPGADAEVDYAQVVEALKGIHEEFVARFQLDLERKQVAFERSCMEAVQKAIAAIPPPKEGPPGPRGEPGQPGQPGEKGAPGKDGKDGLSIENLQREYDPATHEIVETWRVPGSEVAKTLRYPAGGIHYKGYWREGLAVKAGEAWTNEGHLWIAAKDNTSKPGPSNPDWYLGARKGRDGK